jgi:hypothetical protein
LRGLEPQVLLDPWRSIRRGVLDAVEVVVTNGFKQSEVLARDYAS